MNTRPGMSSHLRPLTSDEMRHYVQELRVNFSAAQVINQRGDRLIVRWRQPGSASPVVLKMWARPHLGNKFRHFLGIAPSDYEWKNMRRLGEAGITVPRHLGFCRLVPPIAGYTEALFTEDLGPCQSATEHLKGLIRSGDEQKALAFEDVIIEMTRRLVHAGMIDDDHGLLNIVVQPSGRAVRLDLELCRKVLWPYLFPRAYGRMLGRVIGLHAFAVQPDVERTTAFAGRLRQQLWPPFNVLRHASAYAQWLMNGQRNHFGIDTRLVLPWD